MKTLKHIVVTLYLACFCSVGVSQNLVPNPNLEDTVFCPYAESQMPLNWLLFGNSADYLNGCSSALNVPNTPTGYHEANSGEAMIGLFTYVSPSNPSWPNYREYVGAQLTNPLIIGQKYYMSFYLNFGGFLPNWQQIGADKLGMKFSMVQYSENNPPALNNFAHLYTDSIYIDTTLWVKVSSSFIADSAYNYVMIGNFFDEIQTDTLIIAGPPFGGSGAYYYIDDICVSTDSLFNETWTGIAETNPYKNPINAYPNPVDDILNIEVSKNSIDEVYLINSLGKIVYQMKFKDEKMVKLKVSDYAKGVYALKTKIKNKYWFQLILINH